MSNPQRHSLPVGLASVRPWHQLFFARMVLVFLVVMVLCDERRAGAQLELVSGVQALVLTPFVWVEFLVHGAVPQLPAALVLGMLVLEMRWALVSGLGSELLLVVVDHLRQHVFWVQVLELLLLPADEECRFVCEALVRRLDWASHRHLWVLVYYSLCRAAAGHEYSLLACAVVGESCPRPAGANLHQKGLCAFRRWDLVVWLVRSGP